METFPRDRRLSPRLNLLIKHYPEAWSNEQHERRMQYQCAVQGYRRRRDTNAYYAAMYLLTSNDDILPPHGKLLLQGRDRVRLCGVEKHFAAQLRTVHGGARPLRQDGGRHDGGLGGTGGH